MKVNIRCRTFWKIDATSELVTKDFEGQNIVNEPPYIEINDLTSIQIANAYAFMENFRRTNVQNASNMQKYIKYIFIVWCPL